MCLLSYFPPGIQPDLEKLHNGTISNRDGFGYAIVTARESLIVRRDLKPDRAIEAFAVARARNPEGPAIFHSRFGTSGTKTLGNCHPFSLPGDYRTVVAHNGILGAVKNDDRCDTKIWAEEVLPKHAHFDRPGELDTLAGLLGGGKAVILTANTRYRYSAYILNMNFGQWLGDGSWQSNSGWKNRRIMKVPVWEPCPLCKQADAISTLSGICRHCNRCPLCRKTRYDCQCSPPSRNRLQLALPPWIPGAA